jgi:hypothetical protein
MYMEKSDAKLILKVVTILTFAWSVVGCGGQDEGFETDIDAESRVCLVCGVSDQGTNVKVLIQSEGELDALDPIRVELELDVGTLVWSETIGAVDKKIEGQYYLDAPAGAGSIVGCTMKLITASGSTNLGCFVDQ